MKLAIDSNIVISSVLFPRSVPGTVLAAWRKGEFTWTCCDAQFHELGVALTRPRILARIERGAVPVQALMMEMRAACHWAVLTTPLPAICRDPKDDFLFALRDQSHINMIISGDKDVLALKDNYPILTARELIDRL